MSINTLTSTLEHVFKNEDWQEAYFEDEGDDDIPEMDLEDNPNVEKNFKIYLADLRKNAQFRGGKLIVYRAMDLEHDELQALLDGIQHGAKYGMNSLGTAWTYRKDKAIPYRGSGNSTYIFEALVDVNEIDEYSTVRLATQFGANSAGGIGECEIRLADGATLQLVSMTPKKSKQAITLDMEAVAYEAGPAGDPVDPTEFNQTGMTTAPRPSPFDNAAKNPIPQTAPEAPSIEDYSFPFSGKPTPRVQFKRDEERVNKNYNNFLKRVETKFAEVQAKQTFFPELLKTVKSIYPDMKQVFPKPPTFIWNPEDKEETLDVKKIKDSLKVKLPKLVWSNRFDGVEMAKMEFPDGTYADLAIGEDANHLTITYHIEGEDN